MQGFSTSRSGKFPHTYWRVALLAFLLIITLSGCSKKAASQQKKVNTAKVFSILTIDRIKNTGFLKRMIPQFETVHHCTVKITSLPGSSDLLSVIQNDKEIRKYDLVVGLDNCLLEGNNELSVFSSSNVMKKHPINPGLQIDKSGKIIPYGYGYLALIYNEVKVDLPPESFGELQDVRYLNQLVLSDPHTSGIGRAVYFWTIALFGNQGYQQFWKSIKKNIYGVKDTWQETLQALNSQECGMTFGFTGTPAWMLSSSTNPLPLKSSLMKEGSLLYAEAAAIPLKAKHKAWAEAFLERLLSVDYQQYVTTDLGLFPANDSAPLPDWYTSIPLTSYAVNDKLRQENPAANLSQWLDFWDRLFSHNLY